MKGHDIFPVQDHEKGSWARSSNEQWPVLHLPSDRLAITDPGFADDAHAFSLPSRLSESLRSLSCQGNLSLSAIILTAFQTLLSRYSGQEEGLIGLPALNDQETWSLHPVQARFLLEETFLGHAHRLHNNIQEALTHPGLPIESSHPDLHLDPYSYTTPFQIFFQFSSSVASSRFVTRNALQYDLFLLVEDSAPDFALEPTLHFNAKRFDLATIERIAGHLETLLDGIAHNPQQLLQELPLLTEAERHQLLVEWNRTESDYGMHHSIHTLFEEQVARTPQAVALEMGEQQWTYSELNESVNRLAHYLRQSGVGPSVRVGICLERSLEMIIGLFGILKAGGAYVPIDPTYPKDRLAIMLEDADVALLITEQRLLTMLPELGHESRLLLLDEHREAIAEKRADNPDVTATPETVAYLMFTSGSTGRPKCVMIPHRGVARLVKNLDYMTISPDDVFLQVAPIAFDASIFEIFGSLLNGARLALPPAGKLSLEELGDVIHHHGVSTLFLTSGLFHQMVEDNIEALKRVRYLLSGGDVMSVAVLKKVEKFLPDTRVINAYGPTENSAYTTCYPIHDASAFGASVPIGRPVPNTRVYILDRHMQPVPVGVPGELYTGGAGVSLGYLNRSDLTAERFIPSPFVPGDLLYKTGDLVRYQPDGVIDFISRVDNQVKIRGFRIELGEIETILHEHPSVRDQVVIAREEGQGDKRLVAYLLSEPGMELNTDDVRRFLQEKMPDFMVPSAFVLLDQWPLMQNGKLNFKALPAPVLDRLDRVEPFVVPRNETEELLAGIFASVLGYDAVSVRDSFLDLGGHSLQATQVISRIRGTFAVSLPLSTLFEVLTVERLAERIQGASGHEPALEVPPLTPMTRRETECELSFAQLRMWFVDQYAPGTSMYNLPQAMRMSGILDRTALKKALDEIVQRHDTLRTTFVNHAGHPTQQIAEAQEAALVVVDLSEGQELEREVEAERLMRKFASHPFDLEKGPLFKAVLIGLDAEEHLLVLNTHHVISDGWSQGVFTREFVALYEAFLTGNGSPLPPLPVQYAVFAAWQKDWLKGDVLERQLAYWKKQLSGELPVLQLPTDRPRPAVQTFNGAMQKFVLTNELTADLKAVSKREGVTLFMTLVTAFNTLLARYSGQEDILLGIPLANRQQQDLEAMIGFFVNTLVLRTDLSGNPTFRELLGRVRDMTLGAYSHQDLPFEKLVDELGLERSVSHLQLFQVAFSFVNVPQAKMELPGLVLEQVEVDNSASKMDITLYMEEQDGTLIGRFEYNTDLFDAATIERMSGHLHVLLQHVVTAVDQPLSTLPLLTEKERKQLLVDWNDTRTEDVVERCVHHVFEELAERTPDEVAIQFQGRYLTYGELNRSANRVAHYLQKRGIGVEVLVGVSFERSPEMIIAALGVLKAGGGYVPLDPMYPKERLAYMLEDSRVPVLLTLQHLLDNLPKHAAETICLDAVWEEIARESEENPRSDAHPHSVAYTIYTSGSTGKPKGVLLEHTGVCNMFVAARDALRIGTGSHVLQFSSFSFDACVWEIYNTLLGGGTLHLATQDELLPGPGLLNLLRERGITTVTLPPSVLAVLDPEELPKLATIVSAGEACPADVVARWSEGRRFINAYGPTEATVCTTLTVCTDGTRAPHIGKPLANMTTYILDVQLQPVPVGVPGELHIGGAGLAREYLNRPELTEEKFIAHPFVPGERLYKTGDLVRYLPDGTIEFLGRIDHQVKLRGYRIELSEIEHLLDLHADVRANVVLAREDVPGVKRLIAYVVPEDGNVQLLPANLRSYLTENLPHFMVPSAFVLLDSFPLTPNGKIDRKALPVPVQEGDDHAFVAPQTDVEHMLANLWQELLGVKRVGRQDNFFELGGHSLLATQLSARIRDAYHMEVPLLWLFESSTLHQLAARLEAERSRRSQSQSPLPLRRHEGSQVLSFAQERLWFFDQLEPGSALYNMPLVLRLDGALDVASLERSINEIVNRHDVLRTTFHEREGQPVPMTATDLTLSLTRTAFEGKPDERETQAMAIAQLELNQSFDLAQGPLVRAHLVQLEETQHVLIVTMHHIVSDGWSMGVFVDELNALYDAFAQGKHSPFPLPSFQYADYAAWQREFLQDGVLEKQLGYWKQHLEGTPPLLELPLDHSRPAKQSYRGGMHKFAIPAHLTEALKQLSQQEGVTLFMTLMALYQTWLMRHTNQQDILVGSPVGGRSHTEFEGLIGLFVNTLVFRTQVEGELTFRELLSRVRHIALEAYAHQDVPFEKLVEVLQPDRNLSQSALIQTLLVLQNAPIGTRDWSNLTVRDLETDGWQAKFDLALYLTEMEDVLSGNLVYAADLFEYTTIERMVEHFLIMLEAAVQNPDQKLYALPMLSEAERKLIMETWNETEKETDFTKLVHHRFETYAQEAPDKIALVFEDQQLTYRELNERANRLAHYLQARGVRPETMVGICIERSLEMIVGLLGILKSGAAYVPIDPTFPEDRLSYMFDDTQLSVLVTQETLLGQLPPHQADVICLDTAQDKLSNYSTGNPSSEVHSENIAHIIYTSGTTGRPKGVLTLHRNLVNYLSGIIRVLELAPGASFVTVSTLAADVGNTSIFGALCQGGTLHVLSQERMTDAEGVAEYFANHEIDVLKIVPSHMAALMTSQPERVLPRKRLVVGGEALRWEMVEKVESLNSDCIVVNHYSPTETTCGVLTNRLNKADDDRTTTIVPLGRPINNSQIFILDTYMQPVSIGVLGEVYIGGKSMSRGYHNKPEMTAEKFIPNPFPNQPSPRLYRSGDVAKYTTDGKINFVSRVDHQVKIRGYRIELGEIGTVLTEHPAVREQAVLVREDQPGDKRIVAYVVFDPEAQITMGKLRDDLKKKLPDYMIPTHLIVLDKIPLTPNGKVDSRALPVPDMETTEYVAPRDEVEEIVAEIFAEILDRGTISIHDNFFDFGGHSLLATRLTSRLRHELQIDLPVRSIFEHPTIAEMAESVTRLLLADVEDLSEEEMLRVLEEESH